MCSSGIPSSCRLLPSRTVLIFAPNRPLQCTERLGLNSSGNVSHSIKLSYVSTIKRVSEFSPFLEKTLTLFYHLKAVMLETDKIYLSTVLTSKFQWLRGSATLVYSVNSSSTKLVATVNYRPGQRQVYCCMLNTQNCCGRKNTSKSIDTDQY